MSDIAIRVDGLSKHYRIGVRRERHDTLRDHIASSLKSLFQKLSVKRGKSDTIWALKDVSFEVKEGEVLGVIGRNGAGKSTLLKILSRITEPTHGRIEIDGRVASLLEVGTGFHPELTGRENVYLNGTILGMKRGEIDRKFDEIVAFAEVEQFIDTPVKHYSSGMYLRLAFAVAAHLEPEILIVDEVLAVGDATFQKKCLGTLQDVAKGGRTVLFVSHNMGAINQLCNRVLWMENGRLKREGAPGDTIGAYLSAGETARSIWHRKQDSLSTDEVELTSVCVLDGDSKPIETGDFDKAFQVQIAYQINASIRNLSIFYRVTDAQGNIIWTSWDSDKSNCGVEVRQIGQYTSTCQVPGSLLRPGRYHISFGAFIMNGKTYCFYDSVLTFDISDVGYHLNAGRFGILTPVLEWKVTEQVPGNTQVHDPVG
jgi:lipopolysaccharide transport system ATP-binding protein